MIEYIVPQIIKYKNIDDLLENNNGSNSFFNIKEKLSIDKLLQESFVCIVGEPGIGKSRLINEIKRHSFKKILYTCTASEFNIKSIPEALGYCIIDALDEVEGNKFYRTLQAIKQYKKLNPNIKVLFTCRKHYVASYAEHFATYEGLTFTELCRLSDNDVMNIIEECSKKTKENILKSPQLRELLRIPRYLKILLEYEKEKGDCSNIGELFEYMIGSSIQYSIKVHYNESKLENIKVLIQRVLEKVAFIMEISRKDQISKDELYTILDGIKGNITQMLIANFDLLYFENRILKETNGVLQFENTEIQEYLAAKELCRQDNIESVLYDIAVQKELRHIYPNWYDVIPHISYKDDSIQTFINVIKLIVSYESNLESESFESLLRYVNPTILSIQQKEDLFSIILEHYLHVPAYIIWKSQTLKLLKECYTQKCNNILMPLIEKLNKIQITNIYSILEVIVEDDKLDKNVSDYWGNVANILIEDEDEEKKLIALNIYNALKNKEELIRLSENYVRFTKNEKEKYCEITGYGKFTCINVINCWLSDCYIRNPYAINAVLCIEDSSAISYAYNKIIEADKLYEFFNAEGSLLVCYELHLRKQFNILWNEDINSKLLITKIIASYVDNHSYTTLNEINLIVRQIILEEKASKIFIDYFENKEWDLENLFCRFDAELVDIGLISALDILLQKSKIEKWLANHILTILVNKIRNDEAKKTSISEYIIRYAETFNQWDKNSSENTKMKSEHQELMMAYEKLSDSKVSIYVKNEIAFQLSKNLEFIQQQDTQVLVDVIKTFFNEIDLDKMIIKKNGENSFSLSTSLIKIPYFVRAINCLSLNELLHDYRVVLAKASPIVCRITNLEINEIKDIYKSVFGSLSKQEKSELVEWWKSRKDDFMNISPDNVFACITDYGIDDLSYILEEYINYYIKLQNLSNKLVASKALELISKGYCNWNLTKFKDLFKSLENETIDSIKMQCNAIMIEKFQDEKAITWRINYLENHVVKSLQNDTGHVRSISVEESEIISSNPHMFRCFMNIKENEILNKQISDLFDFALSLCNKPETQEYSSYLLKQIYLFFININNGHYISELRKKVEKFNATNVSYLANKIMNNAEMMYLERQINPINKSIKLYNKCIEESHLEIRNDGDLRRYFTYIQSEVQKEIQDQGIYALVRQETLSEDFIQRELKNTIINKCCQIGLETVQIDREVTFQDNKRTDLLIRYGMCNPIMVELKLLHNDEIQNKKKRQKYKDKFIQYTNATNACLSVFWVFDVHKKGSSTAKFEELKEEYNDLRNILVILTDCKCSSGFETGLSPKENQNLKKNGKKSKR